MLSQDTRYRLQTALTRDDVAAEVSKRLAVSSTPADAAAATAVLATLNSTKAMNDAIAERLFEDMAGNGSQGRELTQKINGMVAVLAAKANGLEVPAVAASFSGQVAGMTTNVVITAVTAGAAGNSISLVADSIKSITTLISDWNTANPANTASLTSGNGAQVPTANITLSGGSDQHDADLAPAKAAMGSSPMSASAIECLTLMVTSPAAATEIKSAYNAMIVAIQAIS